MRWSVRVVRPAVCLIAMILTTSVAVERAAAQHPPDAPDPLLDATRRRAEVAAQKVEADVRAALRRAAAEPDRAADILRQAQGAVENDSTLRDSRRSALVRMLKDRLRQAESTERAPADTKLKPDSTGDAERRLREAVRRWRGGGADDTDAGRQAAVAQARDRIRSTNEKLDDARRLQADGDRRSVSVARDVQRSALPPAGDMELPRDWKERTARRATSSLTAKEQAIFRALDAEVRADFRNSRLEDVIEYFQTLTGINIILDPASLRQAEVSYDTPVTFQVKRATLRTVLRKILADVGLTYTIQGEALVVTTYEKAKESMVVRTYYVGDMAPTAWHAAQLIDLIQNIVEPSSWRANGGEGTIAYHPLTRSLVIKQSAEFHGVLSHSLR